MNFASEIGWTWAIGYCNGRLWSVIKIGEAVKSASLLADFGMNNSAKTDRSLRANAIVTTFVADVA
jgi:hypothetical protein